MQNLLKYIFLWSFAAFFSFAGNGLHLMAHCYNSCKIETTRCMPATDCCEHSEDENETAECHFHRLELDNTIVYSQNIVPDTKILLTLFHLTHTSECYCSRLASFPSFSPPENKIANRDLLAVISCLII